MPLLNAIDLDIAAAHGCQTPGCKHLHDRKVFLNARCHPKQGVDVSYTQGSEVLVVTCRVCHALICEVKVADC